MIKIVSLFVFFITLNTSTSQLKDSVKYSLVFEYIRNSEYIKESFSQYFGKEYQPSICISNQIIKGESIVFLNEIIENDFPNTLNKDSIKNILRNEYNSHNAFIDSNNNFASLYPCCEKNKLIMFFSDIDSNKIYVDIELFTEKIDNYNYITKTLSPTAVLGLFYFKENIITNAYLKKILR